MRIVNVPDRFSRKWIRTTVPGMDPTEFLATFHEAGTRGWTEPELRELARTWAVAAPVAGAAA